MMQKLVPVMAGIIMCFAQHLSAQRQFEGHWGKKFFDVAYANAATDDGGYIITGLTLSTGDTNGDIIVVRTNEIGDTTWSFTYGGPKIEGGNSVIQTADGGFMVSGHTEDFGANDCDAFMMKLDKNGARQWFKVYGAEKDEISLSVVEVPGGGYAFSGITESQGNPNGGDDRHMYFVRTNSDGEVKWTKYYGGSRAEYAYSIVNGYNGGFFANGWSTSFGNGEYDGWLLRLNNDGDTLWSKLFKNGGDTKFFKMIQTQDHGYMMAGCTSPANGALSQGFAVKLDADGKELWRKNYANTTGGIILHDVVQQPNGSYLFSGVNYAADTSGNAYILTTDAMGEKATEELCGGHFSYANCIASQGNNGYMVAGYSGQYGDSYGDLYYKGMDNAIDAGINTIKTYEPKMFPNPVRDKSIILLPPAEANQSVDLDITDARGRTMYSQKNIWAKNLIISKQSLAAGVYRYMVVCKDGTAYMGRFVVAE